jgi:succinate-semialdehyde dehydrogenase / glutarate-semialdehyde dehydrogenase
LVQDGVYDAVTKRLAETAGFEPRVVIGPLIDMKAVVKVEAHIADAIKRGAKVTVGARHWALGGTFFEPTNMVITKEETFGPVAPLYRFKTDGEAIKMANDTEFGLAAYFSTAATSAASGGWPKASNTASSASRASSRPRSLRSAA